MDILSHNPSQGVEEADRLNVQKRDGFQNLCERIFKTDHDAEKLTQINGIVNAGAKSI